MFTIKVTLTEVKKDYPQVLENWLDTIQNSFGKKIVEDKLELFYSAGLFAPKKEVEEDSDIVSAASVKKDSFEVGRSKNGASKIDYASTIEDAYDDLNKILGSDGIKRLTDDTQGLMKQQMELAKSMEAMTPLVKSIAPMIGQMQGMMKNMDGAGVMDIAKKLASGTK
jgi:hypothetical protein